MALAFPAVAQSQNQIEWVQALCPESSGYPDVYNRYGLSRKRSVYAHGVHLRDDEFASLAQTQSLATLGAARALDLDTKIGSFKVGNEADFIVVNPNATDLMRLRMQRAATVEDKLFALQTLGDDRAIEKTYLMGKKLTVTTGGQSGSYVYN